MKKFYKLTSKFPLTIFWNGYAPVASSEWIEVKIDDDVTAKIGLTKTILEDIFIHDIPLNITHHTFPTNVVIIEIDGLLSEEIAVLLRDPKTKETEKLEKFRQDVMEYFKRILIMLINNIRNHFEQFWLSENLPFDKRIYYDALWLDSDGELRRVFPKTVCLRSTMRTSGLTESDWQELETRLQTKARVDMIGTMMANAKGHLENDNSRMAIVESVCALESTIKQNLPPLLSKIVDTPIPEKMLHDAIEKMGLRLTAKIFFEHTYNKFHLDSNDCKNCLLCIDSRNEIIHGKRRTIAVNDAKKLVGAIEKIIKSLSNFDPTNTPPRVVEVVKER